MRDCAPAIGSNAAMRVLGIDPGLRTTGFGVVDCHRGRLGYVASGTIRTGTVALAGLPGRLKIIFDGVREIAARYTPTCASVEIVFVVAAAQIGEEIAARRLRRRPVARAISRSFSWRAFGAAAMLGQFVMQALKRDAGVRSATGALSVTGAVGLLDRLAPLCFAAPVFFHAVRGYFGI